MLILGQSGTEELGYNRAGNAGKSKTTAITFNNSFLTQPVLTYGFMKLDTDKRTNVRVYVQISQLTRTGFTMKVASWDYSVTYNAVVSWMACPKFQ